MASADFALFNQGTGANQNSNQNFALPGMLPSGGGSPSGGGPDFSLFAGDPVSTIKMSGPVSAQPPGLTLPFGGNPPAPLPPGTTPPSVVPPQSTPIPPASVSPQGVSSGGTPQGPLNPVGDPGGVKNVGSGAATVTPLYPQFTQDFYNYLRSQLGKGATPFNLSAALPTGGSTAPGSLTAPLNSVDQMLQQFYSTGTGGPTGTGTLASEAATGNPTDVGPAWQAMVDAQQRNIAQQGANLREQFAFGGDLKSSPFGQAATDFYSQTAKDQNALLGQMQQQASEAAAGRQATAAQELTQGGTNFGGTLQSLDQQSIDNMLAEFIRTNPDYSPLLSQFGGAATTFPPTSVGSVGLGGLGGAAASAGTALSGIADLWGALNPQGGATGSTNQTGVV